MMSDVGYYILAFVFCIGLLIGYLIGHWVAPTDDYYKELGE